MRRERASIKRKRRLSYYRSQGRKKNKCSRNWNYGPSQARKGETRTAKAKKRTTQKKKKKRGERKKTGQLFWGYASRPDDNDLDFALDVKTVQQVDGC